MMVALQVDAAQAATPEGVGEVAPVLDGQPSTPRWDLLAEVAKQAVEQPLHFMMSAAPIWLSRSFTAVPWYGWAIVPALAYREWRQWPSKRWWDPVLDATFLVLGVLTATWSKSAFPLAALRRRTLRAAVMHFAPRQA